MAYEKCEICGEYGWDSHICPPLWFCWESDGGMEESDAAKIYGDDAKEAAENYMQQQMMGGYCERTEMIVDVADYVRINRKKFNVVMEYVPEFTASEKEDSDGN